MAEKFLPDLLPYLLQRASFLVTRRFHSEMRLKGISVSRWRMLAWLSENQPATISDLTDHLMLKQPTVTRLVDQAAVDGLVRKDDDAVDGRRIQVSLTARGRALALKLRNEARAADKHLVDRLGEKRAAALKSDLRQVIGDFDLE